MGWEGRRRSEERAAALVIQFGCVFATRSVDARAIFYISIIGTASGKSCSEYASAMIVT